MSEELKLYGQGNPHPRGIIGEMLANDLLKAGWRETEQPMHSERYWMSPDGSMICTLEQAWTHLTGRTL